MHVDTPEHGTAHPVDWHGIADAGGMIVYQVFLEFLDLLVVEHHLREFADAGVNPVHDLMRKDFPLQHGTAFMNAFNRLRIKFYFFILPGNPDHILDGKSRPFYNKCHSLKL